MSDTIIKDFIYQQEFDSLVLALVLGVSFILGAIHALGPGHGKSLMAAYLVGSRGTVKDALVLSLTITISHVFSVIVLGFIALLVMDFFWTEKAGLWLSVISGILITSIGIWLFLSRIRIFRKKKTGETSQKLHSVQLLNNPVNAISGTQIYAGHQNKSSHNHADDNGDHGHHHHYNPEISLWTNISLGISGGIVPCPKALVILLLAISLQKTFLGIIIISVFSLGLAAVLVTIGIVLVKASHLIKGRLEGKSIQIIPVAGAVIIIGLGLFLTYRTIQLF